MGNRFHRGNILFISILTLFFLFLPGKHGVYAISIEDEQKLSKKFLADIQRHYDLVDDDFSVEYINDLGQYLLKSLKTKPFPFQFHIIKGDELNAFAGPGGHIFVFTGLIQAMNIDELAAILCHEIGHVSSRHLSDRIEQNKKIGLATLAGVLAGSLLGGALSEAVITGSVAAGVQKQLSYSRNDERQADQLVVKYMDETGFNPMGMVSALTKLQRGLSSMNKTPSYLLTHPGATERMAEIESTLASRPPFTEKEGADRFRDSYPLFKTILRARYSEGPEAESQFELELEKDKDSPLAHFGLGIVLKERSEYPEALEQFKKALQGLSESPVILKYLGETYQLLGQDREAIKVFNRILKKNNLDKSTLFLLGISYQNLEEYSNAVGIFERLISMEPVKDEVYYNLGVSLGRQDRLGLAHYNFGIYFKRLHQIDKANFHFQKAKELSRNDPSLLDRIKKAMEN